jgi:hypothetical protein
MSYDIASIKRFVIGSTVPAGLLLLPLGAIAAAAATSAGSAVAIPGATSTSPADRETVADDEADDREARPRKHHHPRDRDGVIRVRPRVAYDWRSLPSWQKITVKRAWFDLNGYELEDAAGNGILIPFHNQTTYVMKFCLASDGRMSVENQGNYPVLYLPVEASIKNATVPRAHWYPFNSQFHPSATVFLSMVPTWDAFVNMPWFEGMDYYGGYWNALPFWPGTFLPPSLGLAVVIRSERCESWDAYRKYCSAHAGSYRTDSIEALSEKDASEPSDEPGG